jgi:hypothetical protein
VNSFETVEVEGEESQMVYGVKVLEVFKGNVKNLSKVREENSSGRLWYAVGGTYIIFTEQAPNSPPEAPADWLQGCSEQEAFRMPVAKQKLEEIRSSKLSAARHEPASIRLRVVDKETRAPMKGVRFLIEGSNEKWRIKSDKEGWAWASLPAGSYQVRAVEQEKTIVSEILLQQTVKFQVSEGGGWDQLFWGIHP